jgi:hypothetical protein
MQLLVSLGAGAGNKVRLALLRIIFKSKGLACEQFNQAQLVHVAQTGRNLLDAVH